MLDVSSDTLVDPFQEEVSGGKRSSMRTKKHE